MERVRHARIPVHLNAVLIGEKTVPKGCKVRNVSDQGMLLTCDADGRILTFRDGDHVDIHLLFQQPEGTKYSTVSAVVRHVDANGIGVEFSHPDTKLVDLIETYRIDETRVLGATLSPRQKVADPGRPEVVAPSPASVSPAPAEGREPPVEASNRRYYYLGLLSLVMAVGIITAGFLGTTGLDKRMAALERFSHGVGGKLVRSPTGAPPAGADMGDYSVEPDPAQKSVGSDAVLERQGTGSATAQGGPPAPLVSGGAAGAAGTNHEEEPPAALAPEPARNAAQETGLAMSGGPATDNPGPWVINLLSSPNRVEAEQFVDRARKQGVPVEQSSVMLNGREHFRVQLTGFRSARQASDNAGPVKEKLGLKEVWIFKP